MGDTQAQNDGKDLQKYQAGSLKIPKMVGTKKQSG